MTHDNLAVMLDVRRKMLANRLWHSMQQYRQWAETVARPTHQLIGYHLPSYLNTLSWHMQWAETKARPITSADRLPPALVTEYIIMIYAVGGDIRPGQCLDWQAAISPHIYIYSTGDAKNVEQKMQDQNTMVKKCRSVKCRTELSEQFQNTFRNQQKSQQL